MREYKAPQAQIVSFANDYVVAGNGQNKTLTKCEYIKGGSQDPRVNSADAISSDW